MPTTTIPLAGNPTYRTYSVSTSTNLQRYVACFFEESPSPITQDKAIYVVKRTGAESYSGASLGSAVGNSAFYSTGLDYIFASYLSGGNDAVYLNKISPATLVSLGSITGGVNHYSEAELSGIVYVLITSSDRTGWYYAEGSETNLTYTADGNNSTTITDIKIGGVNSVAGLYPGQLLAAGTNIASGSRIVSIDSAAFSAVLTLATTGGAFNDLTITKTPIAKILDSDFPSGSITGQFATLNGYTYIMDVNGNIYNSDLNSITSWNPSNLSLANSYADGGRGVIRAGKTIAAGGIASIEFFVHSSNATFGSPLMRVDTISDIGMSGSGSYCSYTGGHGTVFFIGGDRNLYRLEGASAVKLTEAPFIPAVGSVPVLQAFSHMGKRFVQVGSLASTGARWYDIDTGMFTFPGFVGNNAGEQFLFVGPDTQGYCYGILNTGTIQLFRLNRDQTATFQDNSVAYSMICQTQAISLNGGAPFQINSVSLIADTQTSGSSTLLTSADDYSNFGTVGVFSLTQVQKILQAGGYYDSSCVFRVTDSGNQPWRGQALVVDWTPA